MRVSFQPRKIPRRLLIRDRIVEYATREQAQNAVNTLSNQMLMGRLVYVREVCTGSPRVVNCADHSQDREAEPRFIGGPPRGDFGPGRGGFGGGFGGAPGAGGRQLYVSNVCSPAAPPSLSL